MSVLLATLFAVSPAASQDSDQASLSVDDEIVVSASLVGLARHSVGSSVTVIDREEIERLNKTTVQDLLRSVPGVEVAQTGGPGKTTSVFIRGGNASHTLVTIDGVRVNSNTSGAFDFSDLTTANLERIEVIRGPQGLLHGSEAVSGAVNFFTRRGQGPPKRWVRGAVGNASYFDLGAGISGGSERFDYSISATHLETDGVSAADEKAGNTEVDPWRNSTLSGRLGGTLLGNGRIDVALRFVEGDTDVDGFEFGVGPADDLNGTQERKLYVGSLSLSKPITKRWSQTLMVARSQDEMVGKDPDDFFSNFAIVSDTSEVMTRADLSLSDDDSLSVGYRFERRKAENVGSFDESLDISSVFAENLWSWGDRFDLSLGLRNDDHSIFGSELTYRLAFSAHLGEAVRLHGSTGTGFKAPSFSDLYFPFFGNTSLRPETSEAFDLGIELSLGGDRVILDATYFDSQFDDLILFTFAGGFVNVGQAVSGGAELAMSWSASQDFQLRASHTYNETEDVATGEQLARRPKNRTILDFFFDVATKLRCSATVVAVRGRIDSDGSKMDDYERVDLSVDYQWAPRFRPFLRVENLFDADYSEIPGYTSPGLTLAAGARFEF